VVGGGSSPGKNESCGGCFESSEVMVAPTVRCGREAKGRTEKHHACAFWGKGGRGGGPRAWQSVMEAKMGREMGELTR
jgi:hypothetical protein